jgi:hypothetical protein
MNELPDIPRASAPDEIARALAGTTTPAPAREQETVQFNPWIPDERKLKYQPEDFDELVITRGLVHPRDFIKTPATAPTPPELRPAPYNDFGMDEEERKIRDEMPIRKLFYRDASSSTTPLRKSEDGTRDGWDEPIGEPLAKSAAVSPLDRIFAENIAAYSERIAKREPITDTADFSPELASLIEQIVAGLEPWNEDEESEVDYDKRIARELNAALVAAGKRPVLSYS